MGMVDLDENGIVVEQDLETFKPAVLDFIGSGNPSK